jgi:putative membrane protein
MKALHWFALGASALALSACGQKTETTNATTNTVVTENVATPAAAPGQAFANTAAASDSIEVQASTLAAANGQSAAIKKFATEMIKAHTESTGKLKNAASAASPAIIPDPTVTAEQQQTLDSLGALKGAEFDKAYAAAQVDAHTKTLAALKDYAATGDVPQFKTFATELVPIVTAHLNMAKGLKP